MSNKDVGNSRQGEFRSANGQTLSISVSGANLQPVTCS